MACRSPPWILSTTFARLLTPSTRLSSQASSGARLIGTSFGSRTIRFKIDSTADQPNRLDRITPLCEQQRRTPPGWLLELEANQSGRRGRIVAHQSKSHNKHQSRSNGQEESSTDSSKTKEIFIYVAKMKDDWRGSPNRVGLSMISMVVLSGYVAQQIRHHGSGPAWTNPNSNWTDFEFKLWDEPTRILIALGVISLATVKSLSFLLTLSHTIRRISVPARPSNLLTSRKHHTRKHKLIGPKTHLTLYPMGSQDVIYPFRLLFPPRTIEASQLESFGRLTDRDGLKIEAVKVGQKVVRGGLVPLKPIEGGLAVHVPVDGMWGNQAEELAEDQIRAELEDSLKYPDLNDPMLHYRIGFDPRQPLRFNLNVLKAYLLVARKKLLG